MATSRGKAAGLQKSECLENVSEALPIFLGLEIIRFLSATLSLLTTMQVTNSKEGCLQLPVG